MSYFRIPTIRTFVNALAFVATSFTLYTLYKIYIHKESPTLPISYAQAAPQPRNVNEPVWEVDNCKVYRRAVGSDGGARDVYIVKGINCGIFVHP